MQAQIESKGWSWGITYDHDQDRYIAWVKVKDFLFYGDDFLAEAALVMAYNAAVSFDSKPDRTVQARAWWRKLRSRLLRRRGDGRRFKELTSL